MSHYVTGDFSKPNNPIALHALQTATPSNVPSRNSGGTADILPEERKKASFDVNRMTSFLQGGDDKQAKRRFILSPIEDTIYDDIWNWDRKTMMATHIDHFIKVHKKFAKYKPTREEIIWMGEFAQLKGSLMNHHMLFVATLNTLASDQQKEQWLMRAMRFEIIGAYAQTELGHGSNVRGLQTTATFDIKTQEFVLNTPSLTSIKWWPGTLGKVGTHAVLYAQLILDGKEYGVHVFFLQIRDENHRPLPGIEVGDLGPKLGDHANDTGFLRLENVRIPREHLLSKYQEVSPEGKYVKSKEKTNPKIAYTTMVFTRACMIGWATASLMMSSTIATRYSCVRRQGFKDTSNQSYMDSEMQVIDYQVQRYRLFKQISYSYVLKFVSTWMVHHCTALEGEKGFGEITDMSGLPELAATSAGLKAITTFQVAQGIEDLRKCCGGNGYLMSSGIAPIAADYLWQTTAEGDFVLLILMSGKFLLKALTEVRKKPLSGPVEYLNVVREKNFKIEAMAPPQPKSVEQMFDLNYLLSLFKFKALVQVLGVGMDVQQKISQGMSQNEAFNSLSLDIYSAVHAHTMYFMLKIAVERVRSANELNIKKVMDKVIATWAISVIMDDNWAGILSPNQFKLAKQAMTRLLDDLRPDAVALVDAFDIPDNIMSSTIGSYDGNVYERLYEYAKRSELNRQDPFEGYHEFLRPHLDLEFLKHGNKVWNKSKL